MIKLRLLVFVLDERSFSRSLFALVCPHSIHFCLFFVFIISEVKQWYKLISLKNRGGDPIVLFWALSKFAI